LQRALRQATDGLAGVSTYTIREICSSRQSASPLRWRGRGREVGF
jgi:hypothetical protein